MSKQGLTATVWIAAWTLLALAPQLAVAEKRTEKHQQYGQRIWDYVAGGEKTYTSWATAADAELPDLGPPRSAVRTYFNQTAVSKASAFPYRSAIVIEHLDGDEPTVAGLTVLIRQKSGYRPESDDWYWSHFSPDGRLIKCCVDRDPLDKPGFVTFVNDGRLWVFRLGSGALAEYLAVGEPAKNVTRPAAGPGGMTLRSDDNTTLDAYGAAQEGFVTEIVDGRIWVLVKIVRPGYGPGPDVADRALLGYDGWDYVIGGDAGSSESIGRLRVWADRFACWLVGGGPRLEQTPEDRAENLKVEVATDA